MTDIDIKNISF